MDAYFETLSEAVNTLRTQGYTDELIIGSECLLCQGKATQLPPDRFRIDAFYRFEGDTDPGDDNILYAVSSNDGSVKGLVVTPLGAYRDSASAELLAKLNVH